jgi:MFS family permease
MPSPAVETEPQSVAQSVLSAVDKTTPDASSTIELANLGAAPANDAEPVTPTPAAPEDDIPNGGRTSWLMIACCTLLAFWFIGTTYSWGVLQAALVDRGLAPASTLAFIGSLAIALLAVLAMINSRALSTFGAQKMGIVGVLFLGLGQILASFSTHNIAGLFLTAGVMMGIGVSMCFMVVSIMPVQYFSTKRGTAVGIVYGGGGIGGAVISLSLEAGVRNIGVEWTFRMVGILMLATCLPAAWFIQERFTVARKQFVDWSLFKQLDFNLLFLAGSLGTFPLIVPPFFLPLYAQSLHLSATLGAVLVSAWNFSSALGRIFTGLASDRLFGPINTLFIVMSLICMSLLVLWPTSTSFAPLLIFTIINGAASGGFFSIMPTVVGSVMDAQRMATAFGMIVTGWVGGYIAGAPIAGYLLNAFGGAPHGISAYRPAMFLAGGIAAAAAALVAGLRFRKSPHVMIKM